MKVSDYIVEFLSKKGVEIIFGYQGSSIAHIIDSISKHGKVEYMQLYHEQAAGFAANGYASTGNGKFGVAVVCSGPGSTNLVTSIANAFYDSIPCFFITGQVSTGGIRTNKNMRQLGFQETDIVEIVKTITKYAVRVEDTQKIGYYLDKAYYMMMEGRKGPVLIDIPHNVQAGQIEMSNISRFISSQEKKIRREDEIRKVESALKDTKRPLILVGGGLSDNYTCSLLKNLVNKWDIPVVSSYRGKDKFDNFDKHYIGTIGAYGNRCANIAIQYCDFLLVLGSRIDGRQTGDDIENFAKDAKIIYIDIDQSELDEKPKRYIKIKSSIDDFLKNIEIIKPSIEINNWKKNIQYLKEKFNIESEYKIAEDVNPQKFLRDITLFIQDKKYFLVADVGQNQIWINSSGLISEEGKLLQSCGLGAMGYSLPAAIGAYYAEKVTGISVSGDGGIQMNIQEFQTVARENIPLKIFIMNNNSLGLIRVYQEKALQGNYVGSVQGFSSPDYRKLAMAYGIKYYLVTGNNYNNLIKNILEESGPVIVEVRVSSNSTAYPGPAYKCAVYNQEPLLKDEEWKDIEEKIYE